jgi:hypothetical protein
MVTIQKLVNFYLTWAVGCSPPPVEKMVPAADESGQWGAATGRSSNNM